MLGIVPGRIEGADRIGDILVVNLLVRIVCFLCYPDLPSVPEDFITVTAKLAVAGCQFSRAFFPETMFIVRLVGAVGGMVSLTVVALNASLGSEKELSLL